MVLERINSPADVKKLSIDEMHTLAGELRERILNKVNTIGGHAGPNLGIVEATIALHYVFNSPVDKIVFDVSHQCYAHKMLTGRKDGFVEGNYMKYTGYTAPEESKHDLFKVGHTSTSVSLATGVAKARDLKGEKYNVIALIGDGSLSGGEALEGLDNAATLNSNIIILVNDNDMSIAENHGSIYANLKKLRETDGKYENNFFTSLGYDYYFIKDGNNVEDVINTFKKVKDTDHPTVIHMYTEKGHGFAAAVADKETYHWSMPGILDKKEAAPQPQKEDWNSITKDYHLQKVKEDKNYIVVTAATPGVFGFDKAYREKLGKQYTDVGIAEEHAVAYSSALAKQGAKPVFHVMSSFIQRTYDQLSQDLALNNSPMTMLVYWGGISAADCTHLCTFDVSLISNIPNIVYMAPTNKEEYLAILDWSVNQTEHPVAIRVPTCEMVSTGVKDTTDYSILNKFKMIHEGSKVAILGLGNFFFLGEKVQDLLKSKLNIDATLINPIYMTGLDKDMLNGLKDNHDLVITLEDNILDGGFGEKVASFYGNSDMRVLNFGAEKDFPDRVPLNTLYERYHLTPELIVKDIEKTLKTAECSK